MSSELAAELAGIMGRDIACMLGTAHFTHQPFTRGRLTGAVRPGFTESVLDGPVKGDRRNIA